MPCVRNRWIEALQRPLSVKTHEGVRLALQKRMKIASFNVNGVNGRITRLIEWLDEAQRACEQ